jgi:hypothetical protein
LHNAGVRSFLLLVAAVLYLAALGAPCVKLAKVTHGQMVSLIADDTDLDDDELGTPCLHSSSIDSGFQNFDLTVAPLITFRPEAESVIDAHSPAATRLDEGGLFRPPRASLFV